MNGFKYSLLLLLAGCCSIGAKAQMIADPTDWKYEVKKKSATEYQLIFHLNLKKEWHIWSMKPGGDGFQIIPSFAFDNNANVKLVGKVSEKGKAITSKMEGVDGAVTYYNGKVDYIQNVAVTGGKAKIAGKHTYQVCNDRMCLPPKDKDFVFEIK